MCLGSARDTLKNTVFKKLPENCISHPATKGTRPLTNAIYFWPDMDKQVNIWTSSCTQCQKSKVYRHVKAPGKKIATPKDTFEHNHLDMVGHLPTSKNRKYILTIIDRFTRWPEAYILLGI